MLVSIFGKRFKDRSDLFRGNRAHSQRRAHGSATNHAPRGHVGELSRDPSCNPFQVLRRGINLTIFQTMPDRYLKEGTKPLSRADHVAKHRTIPVELAGCLLSVLCIAFVPASMCKDYCAEQPDCTIPITVCLSIPGRYRTHFIFHIGFDFYS